MHAFPLIISFYTKDTYYQWEVQNLIESCQKFGLEHYIEGVDSFGSWELNCAFKPFFIYEALQKHKRAVFWLDADAAFVQKPEILSVFESDLAVRINDLAQDHPSKVLSGSLFVNYTTGANRVMRLWIEECQRQLTDGDRKLEFWDQIALRDVILNPETLSNIGSLPHSYTKISGHVLDEKNILSPVIEHYQASRRYKKMINATPKI